MVEDIEELRPEAEIYLLREEKLTLNRDIGLRGSEPAQYVAAEIALYPVGAAVNAAGLKILPPG